VIAVLLVVAGVTAATWLYVQKGETVEVLVLARAVPAGHEITAGDLTTAQVSGVEGSVTADDASTILGQFAVVGLVPGQVLNHDALTTQALPSEGERMVALNIPVGRLPVGVEAGSAVEVLAAPAPGQGTSSAQFAAPKVIAARALAHDVEVVDDGTVVLTLRLDEADADLVAAHSAAGEVTVIQIPVGE